MKKLMVFLILLSASLQGFGRITDDEKGFTIGTGFGYWCQNYTYFHTHHFIWSLRAGYRFTPDIEAGAFFRKDTADGSNYSTWLGIYGEYGFRVSGQFRLFADGDFSLIAASLDYDDIGYDRHDSKYWELGFRPGVGYKLKSLPIEFKLRYLFVGFDNLHHGRTGACLGKNDWIIDAGLRRLEIGAAVTF